MTPRQDGCHHVTFSSNLPPLYRGVGWIRVAGHATTHIGKTDFAPPGTARWTNHRGGTQALDVPEILMRQPDCLFHTHAGEEGCTRNLDKSERSESGVSEIRMDNRGDVAACRERRGARHETCILVGCFIPANRWGEASRVPDRQTPRLSTTAKRALSSRLTTQERLPLRGPSSSSVRVPVRARGLFQPYPNS